jgi:hypothetical protein
MLGEHAVMRRDEVIRVQQTVLSADHRPQRTTRLCEGSAVEKSYDIYV